MRFPTRRTTVFGCLVVVLSMRAASIRAASPSAEQALELQPIQKDVEISQPAAGDAAKCVISAKKVDGMVAWVVEDAGGTVLRMFADTNGDNVVDQWSYFRDGLEVYRDIDSNFNGKADQYRWFNTGGCRWGLDQDENGTIDSWKAISAEEVSAEAVAALANRDPSRFERLLLSASELKSLGLGTEKTAAITKKLDGSDAKFRDVAGKQAVVNDTTKWLQFGGSRPGVVPAGREGATKELKVYENAVALVKTGDEHGQVFLGTLVQVGDAWRMIDAPQPVTEQLASDGLFFETPAANRMAASTTGPSDETQKLLAELEKLDATSQSASPEDLAKINAHRADLLEQIAQAAKPEERAIWIRQLADTISAAVQAGNYPDGAKRLETVAKQLEGSQTDRDLAAYVKFRQLTAEYGQAIAAKGADFVKIQTEWLKKLEQYIADFPKSPDAAEAMLQLAIAQEFAGQEEEARKWYGRIVQEFPDLPPARKAAGAVTRLESVGKAVSLQGKSPTGETIDLNKYRGQVVLVQYWASWCEPCKADMTIIKDLVSRYGRNGFTVIGVNLDTNRDDMARYTAENSLPWPQIREDGGLESRPALDLGILTLPTMLLIDQQGRVINRNIQISELDTELKKLVR